MKKALVSLAVVCFFFINTSAQNIPQKITIERDGIQLSGNFYSSGISAPSATVIIMNGFPGNENDVIGLGGIISQSGINVLTLNYSGTYKSQGLVSFENNLKDINAAFQFIHNPGNISNFNIDTNRIILGGWCHGGGMSMVYASLHPEIKRVFYIAGNDFMQFLKICREDPEIRKGMENSFAKAEEKGLVRFDTSATFRMMIEKGADPKFDYCGNAGLLADRDIFIAGGWDDVQTTIEGFLLPFYRALRQADADKVRIVTFQDDHYFKKTRNEVAGSLISWINNPGIQN